VNDATRRRQSLELAPMAVVEDVRPQVDHGRFAVKRVVGEEIVVTAGGFAHGHEQVACALRYRGPGDGDWTEIEMRFLGNDEWSGAFTVDRIGTWQYCVACWIDHLASWRAGFARRIDAEDVRLAARIGAELVSACAARASAAERESLARLATALGEEKETQRQRTLAGDEALFALARRHAPRDGAIESPALAAVVERERARFSTWYEFFPRSTSPEPGEHGTFADAEDRLDDIAAMGFDVVYLPPIHPVGREMR